MLDLTSKSEMWNSNQLFNFLVVIGEEFSHSVFAEIELRSGQRSDLLFLNPSPSAFFDEYSCRQFVEDASQEGWVFLFSLEDVGE